MRDEPRLTTLLAEASAGPDDIVVHAGAQTWTRTELDGQAERLAAVLRADQSVPPGALVGVMLPSDGTTIASLFGVWRSDAVYVPLNPRLTAPELARILDDLQPSTVITTEADAARVPDDRGLVITSGRDWRSVRPPTGPTGRQDPGVALVQFTSGTTGAPKAVPLRHDGVLTLIDGVLAKLGATRSGSSTRAPGADDRPPMPNLIPVSLSLWAGLYNVLFAFRVGSPVVVMDRFDPRTFASLVRHHGIRSTVLPPAAMATLTATADLGSLAPLRFVRCITAPLSPVQARRFHERFGISVLNSYGQTEIGGEIVGWNAADSRAFGTTKLGSVGRPHDAVSIRVVDDAGVAIEPQDQFPVGGEAATDHRQGELWVRTPTTTTAHAAGADLADRLSTDGWFRTGDLGWVDTDGFVWIEGRVSDQINRGGLKVFPAEVEEVLRGSPLVTDVVVTGLADDRLGEVPWAFVVTTADDLDADAVDTLDATCRAGLAPYKVPVGFTAVTEIPRNEVGKVQRARLPDPPGRHTTPAAARPAESTPFP